MRGRASFQQVKYQGFPLFIGALKMWVEHAIWVACCITMASYLLIQTDSLHSMNNLLLVKWQLGRSKEEESEA